MPRSRGQPWRCSSPHPQPYSLVSKAEPRPAPSDTLSKCPSFSLGPRPPQALVLPDLSAQRPPRGLRMEAGRGTRGQSLTDEPG